MSDEYRNQLWQSARQYAREAAEVASRLVSARPPTKVSYVLCATPRSGSGLIASVLWRNCVVGRPSEYFAHWMEARDPAKRREKRLRPWLIAPEAYVRKAIDEGTTYTNGVVGMKIMHDHLNVAMEQLRSIPEYREMNAPAALAHMLPNLHYVYITRRAKVEQAVSWAKAAQSGEWFRLSRRQGRTARPRPSYDFKLIEHYYNAVMGQERSWEAFFQEGRIQPHRVVHEDFVRAWRPAAAAILSFLTIPGGEQRIFGYPAHQPQADALNAEWAARFRKEYGLAEIS